MTLEQQLAAAKARAAELRTKAAAGTDWTADDTAAAKAVGEEISSLEQRIAGAAEAAKALGFAVDSAPLQTSEKNDDGANTPEPGRTMGERFTRSKAYQTFREENPSGVHSNGSDSPPISIKAARVGGGVASKASTVNSGAQGNARAVRTGEVDDLVNRPERRILDLITRGRTNLPWFQYRQVISKTNNAAIVAEAVTDDGTTAATGLKPLSTLTTTTADAKAFTYADGMEVTNQELSDDGIIESLIDSTLRENLEILVEHILLNGAGTATEPAGLFNTTGVLQQSFDTDVPTSLRRGITKLQQTSNARIRGILMNPEDDADFDLLTGTDGHYLYGAGPYSQGPKTAWSYERITSPSIPVGRAVMGDFSTIHLLQLEDVTVNAFNQHADFARKNLVYIRAEERAVQLIRNAARLCVVDLTAA